MNIKNTITYASNLLASVGIKSPTLEARILLKNYLKKDTEYLISNSELQISEIQQFEFKKILNRRLHFEPIAYIVGQKEFYGYNFLVDKTVLIPRQDTEILIDIALVHITKNSNFQILDLGTGSGCIGITLLLERKNLQVTASDISNKAIKIATLNAKKHSVFNKLILIKSNWWDNIINKFDIIISNPPYIAYNDKNVIFETYRYEPHLALFAKKKGLGSYYSIAKDAKFFLKKHGKLIIEIGFDQAKQIKKIFQYYNYLLLEEHNDLAGHTRCIVFTLK